MKNEDRKKEVILVVFRLGWLIRYLRDLREEIGNLLGVEIRIFSFVFFCFREYYGNVFLESY